MPELRTMAAADWVCEGLRATYYGAAATLPADRAVVSGNAPGPDGSECLLITETRRGFEHVMGYSKATGRLVLFDDSTHVGFSLMRTQVQWAGG